MAPPDPGWSWLEPAARPAGDDQSLALARACARVFADTEGEWVLAHLKGLTLDRCLSPDASDAALRCLEGQRQLVLHILSLVARGREGR